MPPTRVSASFTPSPLRLFSSHDAERIGIRLDRIHGLVSLRHGVYANRDDWNALKPWERYLARVHAFALRHPDVVFCLESAAALRALPLFGQARDVHVYDPGRKKSRRFGDVFVHATRDDLEIDESGDLRTTATVATAVQLMRVLPPAFGLAVGDAAVRGGRTDVEGMRAFATSQSSGRGLRRLRWLLDRVTPEAESPGESVSRAVVEWCGFAIPDLQERFHIEGFEDRTDFFWPGVRAAGESDGYDKYKGESPQDTERALIAEKKREDRLRRHLRGFARWDFGDAMNSDRLAAKLSAAGVPLLSPPNHVWLKTLRSNPRSI